METTIEKQDAILGQWVVGHVISVTDGVFTVKSGTIFASGHRAVGCLVEPQAHDVVACVRVAPEELWIISILSREANVPNVINMQGETRIQIKHGNLNIDSESLVISANCLQVAGKEASIGIEDMTFISRDFKVTSGSLKIVTSFFSTVAQRMTQYCKSYFRNTDGMDKVAATHIELQAKQLMRCDAENTLVTGKNLVKARGAQIHFG
jgi:Protein of unknown function (DUF3540)